MKNQESVNVTINSQKITCQKGLTLGNYLLQNGFEPQKMIVEINGHILKVETFIGHPLQDRDQIEIIQFVGGG